MKMFFQMLVILLLGFVTSGCMTEYGHFEGLRVSQNYPAGSSNWQPLPPTEMRVWHIGNGGGGGFYTGY